MTQKIEAQKGIITKEMETVAREEEVSRNGFGKRLPLVGSSSQSIEIIEE